MKRFPSRERIAALARWVFFQRGERRLKWRELAPGIVILVAVAIVNTACQQKGLYDRFEWADLDRLQRTAPATGAGGVSLVVIDDDDYEALFSATSPLDPVQLVKLIESVCRFSPRVVGVDILTSDWFADSHDNLVARRLGDCPIVWVSDVLEAAPPGGDPNGAPQLRLGRTLGLSSHPPDVCTAVSMLQPDRDGVIRSYALSFPRLAPDGSSLMSNNYPTIVAMVAGYARTGTCAPMRPQPNDARAAPRKIRYTSNESFPDVPARLVLEAANDSIGPLHETLTELLRDRIVIVGGTYRHARDKHVTPIGPIHGAELIANAVYTELEAPIADVRWWQSLSLDIAASMVLLLGLVWSGLRWPWATLGSIFLSVLAAMIISWNLHKYLGYFLGVLGGLMGVVLAEVTSIIWKPLREMWRSWLREYPALAQSPTDELMTDARAIEQTDFVHSPAIDGMGSTFTTRDPLGRSDP